MTDKEKMIELKNWLKVQKTEVAEKRKEADESGDSIAIVVGGIVKLVLLQVLLKIEEIEKDD